MHWTDNLNLLCPQLYERQLQLQKNATWKHHQVSFQGTSWWPSGQESICQCRSELDSGLRTKIHTCHGATKPGQFNFCVHELGSSHRLQKIHMIQLNNLMQPKINKREKIIFKKLSFWDCFSNPQKRCCNMKPKYATLNKCNFMLQGNMHLNFIFTV